MSGICTQRLQEQVSSGSAGGSPDGLVFELIIRLGSEGQFRRKRRFLVKVEASDYPRLCFLVSVAAFGTYHNAAWSGWPKPVAVPAHPSFPACRHAYHQSVIGHVAGHNRSRCNKSIAADLDSTNDRGVGAYGGAAADEGFFVQTVANHLAPRVGYIGQDAAGAQKDIVLQYCSAINGNIVLEFAVVSYPDAIRNKDILAEIAVGPDYGSGTDMAEMPYLAVVPDLCARIDKAAGMHEICGRVWHESLLLDAGIL